MVADARPSGRLPPRRADCPPDCAECAADDGGWAQVEAQAEQLLARHDAVCVGEAVQDAYDLGHDDHDGIRLVAAQLLEDRYSSCRCGQLTAPAAEPTPGTPV